MYCQRSKLRIHVIQSNVDICILSLQHRDEESKENEPVALNGDASDMHHETVVEKVSIIRYLIGLCGAPKISVLRGSQRTVRVSILEFRISVRFIFYIGLSKQLYGGDVK